MSGVKTHKDLDIWKRGIEFVEGLYKVITNFPKEEIYGLVSQIRRAGISYPSNIAEGAARFSKKEFIHFLYISLASLSEAKTQLIIAEKLGYLKEGRLFKEVEILRRMTLNFIKYLNWGIHFAGLTSYILRFLSANNHYLLWLVQSRRYP